MKVANTTGFIIGYENYVARPDQHILLARYNKSKINKVIYRVIENIQ